MDIVAGAFQEQPLGQRIESPIVAADSAVDMFTVANGLILVTSLVGIVTTAIGDTIATLKLQADPVATGSTVDLCAAVAVTSDIVGTLYSITGTAGDNIEIGSIGAVGGMSRQLYVAIGNIESFFSADPVGGTIRWILHYIPVDDNAIVSVA